MDHAHLLQRSGRNLRRLHGRNRPAPRSPPPTLPLHRPPLPPPRRHRHAHLHRRLPLLRRKSLARLPQHTPPHLVPSRPVLSDSSSDLFRNDLSNGNVYLSEGVRRQQGTSAAYLDCSWRPSLPIIGAVNMKAVLAILLLSFATASFAQTAPVEQAAAPGCGKDDVKFDVKTEKSQHPFAKPDPGKALVYLLQDDTDFRSNPRPTTP